VPDPAGKNLNLKCTAEQQLWVVMGGMSVALYCCVVGMCQGDDIQGGGMLLRQGWAGIGPGLQPRCGAALTHHCLGVGHRSFGA
jgi:hypothetical protein